MTVLMKCESGVVSRFGGDVIFRDLNWTIREGETWAIVGPVGSGKTTLAEMILGRHRLIEGVLQWPALNRPPADAIRRVSFKEESRAFSYSKHYYQQRFNFIEPDDDISLDTFLRVDRVTTDAEVQRIAEQLGIAHLLALSLIKLSNGQMRRARLARALLAQPEWILLDEPFMGLDSQGRHDLVELLRTLIQQGIRITLITRPEMLPDWVTHVIALEQQHVTFQGERSAFHPEVIASEVKPIPVATLTEPIIELTNVNVAYGGKRILHDLNWTVRRGERWALLGPNGAGKTTLLSLIAGDHPQAYSNDLKLWGRQRGSGESIWDIKRKIGLLSPEFHLYFTEPLSAFDTASTGFHDVLVQRAITDEQHAKLSQLFTTFDLMSLADKRFTRLSTGQQRLVLLLRAIVKSPQLLILDEPFQGLDSASIARAREWLDTELSSDQTLIFVTHYEDEIPQCVTKTLRLTSP